MMKELMHQMVNDLRDCARDDYGPHGPEFYPSDNRSAGENLSVTVQWSRDPARSNNGGEYYEDRRYFVGPNGSVHSYLVSSYEDADPEDWTDHGVALSLAGIGRCLKLASERVLAELAPKPIDSQKVRRRVEDALRKTATDDDIVAVAGLLGVKID